MIPQQSLVERVVKEKKKEEEDEVAAIWLGFQHFFKPFVCKLLLFGELKFRNRWIISYDFYSYCVGLLKISHLSNLKCW